MELIVTRADNSTYNLPSENSKITSAVQTRTLMGEDTVVMTVQSVGYVNFLIGDWIEVFGRQYTLNTLGEPRRIGENTFEYNLVFEGVNYELTKVVYRSADYSGFNPTSDFPLTGTAEGFLTVLQYNLERAFGQGVWAIGSFPATEAKTLSFTSENCLLALNRVCSEFGLEYEIKVIGGVKTINLGAVGDTLPLNLEYGKGKGLYSLTRTNVDSKNIVTRLYVEGSDRNVKAGYRDNALRLRIAANTESYIDSASAASFGVIEGSKIFEDIFPHREGTVSAINASDILEFTDSSMDFDLAETDTNGTKWLIAGQSAKIHFNTGALAGYEFELTAYNHTTKTFKIKPFKDERGLQFPNPDSAAFQIKAGDKYVILDIIMPDSYIQAAETELLSRAQEYLAQNDQPRVEYSLDLDRFFLKSMFSGPGFEVNFLDAGDYLHIKDSKIGVDKEVRVKTFTRDVLAPWVYQVSLSDVIEPTRIELLLADTLETKKAARQGKLFDPARSRRNWRDVEEVAGMVDTLRAEVALIGSPEGQFQVDSFFEVNKGGNPDSFGATAGVLAHDAFEGNAGSVWNIGAFDVALSNSGAYYLYAQCSRVNTGAVFTVSLTKIGVEDVGGYYHFPVGIISSVKDNARTLTTVYGYTLISGNNITTGIIQNDQSGIMINLQTGEIRGAFTFTNGQLVESVVNTKNSRYTQGTDPSASWTTLEEKQKHVDDIWAKILTDGIEEYVYTEVSVGVYEWVLNEAEIDGGRIKAGTIDASRIDVTGLFAEEINATNFNLEKGRVGAFEVDTVLKSENEEGKGIYINPSEYEIAIENKSEGFGVSSVNMKAGSLTPYLLLAGGTSGTYRSTVNSNEVTTSITSVQTRATGGVNLPPLYMGRSTSAQGRTSLSVPTGNNRISLATGKNYSVDLRYLFNVYHSGGSANGETYKLQGALKVSAVATLYGVTATGVTKVLGTKAAPIVTIERSDKRTGNDFYPITIKTAFSSQDCIYAYWKLDVNLQGDLTYQRYSNDWGWKYYWETKTDWAIDYKHSMGALSSFYPSVGVTELTTSGFQTVWATNRYFRIDGEDSGAFIRSVGTWMHNNYEVATANDINTITADLTNYVLINDLQSAYYNKTESDNRYAQKVNYYDKDTSDGRFAKLAGGAGQDFNVKDLIIHGQVNHWLAQQLVVDDARIQVNRRQDGVTVDSGLVIYNKDTSTEVSNLVYDVNGIWKAGGNRLFTEAYNPKLGGYAASSYPRKAEDAVITGKWTFNNDVYNRHIRLQRGSNLAAISVLSTGALALAGNDSMAEDVGAFLSPAGNLGLGKFSATERLHVAGNGLFTGNLTAGGNVGTSNFVSQMQGWRVTPQGQADFRHIFTDELQAKAFTADISQALVGSDVLTKSVAKLAQNWATTANGATSSIYVEELEGFPGFQVFAVGDRLLLRLFDRSGGGLLIKNIWATVASYVSTTKNVQRYTITVNSGGAAGQTVYAGSMILDYGTPGSGVIERTVLDQQGSPYSRVSTWVNNPWTPGNYTLHYQSGNLNGIPNTEGWGVYSENSFLTGKLLVGDLTKAGQYMEYANGQLNIKGKITVTGGNAATKEDVDAVQVGGRNLIISSEKLNINIIGPATRTLNAGVDVDGGNKAIRLEGTGFRMQKVVKGNGVHTFSVWVKKYPQSTTESIKLDICDGGSTYYDINDTWQKITLTHNVTNYSSSTYNFVDIEKAEGFDILIYHPKLEKGNRATDWTPAPEDVDAEIASAKQEALTAASAAQTTANTANETVEDLNTYVDGAFKDGVISAAEAKAIEKYKNTLNEAMAKAESSYSKVYANSYLSGTAKTALQNAKINLWGQRDTLISAINTAIAGGTTTSSQKTAVDNAFNTFNNLMTAFQNALEEANKAIQVKLDNISKGYADAVQVGGRNLIISSEKLNINIIGPATRTLNAGVDVDGGNKAIRLEGTGFRMRKVVKGNGVHTFSVWVKRYPQSTTDSIKLDICDGGNTYYDVDDTWQKIILTHNVTNYSDSTYNFVDIERAAGFDILIYHPKLETGNRATDWTPAPEDVPSALDYIATAIQDGSTDIEGGLLSTNILKVKDTSGAVTGGMSGLSNDNVGFWAGGSYQNALDSLAKVLFRKDGSGQMAGGLISFTEEGDLKVGDIDVDSGGTLLVKEGTADRIMITKGNITTLAGIAASTQDSVYSQGPTYTSALGTSTTTLTGNITVTNDNSSVTITGTLATEITRPAPDSFYGAYTLIKVSLIRWNDMSVARTQTVQWPHSSGSGKKNFSTSLNMGGAPNLRAGTYRIQIEFNHVVQGPSTGFEFYSEASGFSTHVVYDGAKRITEIGKNGIGVLANKDNYSFFGVENGVYKIVEKTTGVYDRPGVLLAGRIETGGGLASGYWGAKYRGGSAKTGTAGEYQINHSIGHSNYYISPTPTTDVRLRITAKTNTYCRVRSSSTADVAFDFIIVGNNQ